MFKAQKPLRDQVLVITGATSGIGLATARLAASRGARLVLAARSRPDLERVIGELGARRVAIVAADVGVRADVEEIARIAIASFGRIDTWINNAGQTVYGRLEEVQQADLEALMRVNFWGTVNGSLVAVRHMKAKGGTLINVGSIGSDFAFPLQTLYSASKHAIRGFTDTLRMELEQERAPISVTLIKPASIDTPLPQRARNYLKSEPKLPPPVYRPHEVALAIMTAATTNRRDIYVGGLGRAISAIATASPRLFDLTAPPIIMALQQRSEAARGRGDTLHGARSDGHERGSHPGFVIPVSVYTRLFDNIPLAVGLAGLGAVALLTRPKRR